MICLNAAEVERRFELLGIPNRFIETERLRFDTTDVVQDLPGIFGFPTPADATGLNILNLRRILGVDPVQPPSFFDHPWYLEEPFASVDCEPGWHFLNMAPLADSISKPLDYVRSLSPRGLIVPAAVEVVLMLFLNFAGTKEQLLLKKHTWCSDQASLNRFVTVGAFGRNGLFVSGHPPDFASRGLGICGKLTTLPISG